VVRVSTNGTPPPPPPPPPLDPEAIAAALDDVARYASRYLALWVSFRLVDENDEPPPPGLVDTFRTVLDELERLADSSGDALEIIEEATRG
jgi:hypothetical protein